MTPLMWAARNGHTDTVESLVAAGAELNTLDEVCVKNYNYAETIIMVCMHSVGMHCCDVCRSQWPPWFS